MIHDARTSQILAQAKQHRANVIGDFFKSHRAYVVLALALGALILTVGQSMTTDVTTASTQAEATDVRTQ